ncbi:MAG: gliding motility-associated C-terminal domain-containing protein, partial [Bacteroidota bacterium]|nr:gliding motility-associated C-terminal domain-containing protein [Bacteroidota bacterium]
VNDIEVIYVPEAFTPNGDNINDVFYVVGNGLKEFKLFIFNRWGEEIFESDDINLGWDGKVQDKLVPQGVYTYRIIYRKNSTPADKLIKIGALLLLKEEF